MPMRLGKKRKRPWIRALLRGLEAVATTRSSNEIEKRPTAFQDVNVALDGR